MPADLLRSECVYVLVLSERGGDVYCVVCMSLTLWLGSMNMDRLSRSVAANTAMRASVCVCVYGYGYVCVRAGILAATRLGGGGGQTGGRTTSVKAEKSTISWIRGGRKTG